MNSFGEAHHTSKAMRRGRTLAVKLSESSSGQPENEPTFSECYAFGSFRLFPKQRTLLSGTARVGIKGRAFDLLLRLVAQAGNVVSSQDLMHGVWPNINVEETNLRVQMAVLRKILAQFDGAASAIETIPMRGYCFVLPVRQHLTTPILVDPEPSIGSDMPILPDAPIGRDDAIRIAQTALRERRLVTITGPGGIGKTTVAIATARRYAASSGVSVIFVDLSYATDGAGVVQAIAEALRLEPGRNGMQTLRDHLRSSDSLLLLDTCELIVEPVALLAEVILSHCPDLKMLVTSQAVLRATGEWTYRLPSLTFPTENDPIDLTNMTNFSAVTLFVERVRSSTPFEPDRENLKIIAEICQRLGGIPLALEFAAARATDLGLQKTAAHLNDCFAILTQGRRTALPRHRTLLATLDWSYSLLSKDEQAMLSVVAAFGGSFTAEQAAARCTDSLCTRPSEAFFGLYEKSFLMGERPNSEPRFRLLDTVRSYVTNKNGSTKRQRSSAAIDDPGAPESKLTDKVSLATDTK